LEILAELWSFSPYILSPSFLLAMGLLFYRDRPKVDKDNLKLAYINDATSQKIEQRELDLNWGKTLFFRKLKIMEIPKNADYEVTFFPIDGTEITLPYDCFTEKTGKVGRVV
jgi:hypothetical protein